MLNIIESIGGETKWRGADIYINCRYANPRLVDANLTSGIRSSIFILGPILSRFRYAQISYPGGCDIGLRPIDLHIMGFRRLNVRVEENNGMLLCDGEGLRGGIVNLDFPSVGATENLMMAGVLAGGKTVIRNAAREPEIVDLQNFINYLGGQAHGAGTDTIVVTGTKKLSGGEYSPVCDRIVAGTYLAAAAMCTGDVTLKNVRPHTVYSVIEKLARAGCELYETHNSVRLIAKNRPKAVPKIETQPFPGFPTDMQAQITAMLSVADGSSMIVENLFENRFRYTMQLAKMGADITVKDRVVLVKGVKALRPAATTAEDLRGGAALVSAALCADGVSEILGIHHIDRGYESIESDLSRLNADIRRAR
jgi:UDP-N-acetylglucosamine 1-carboxyvinyltransferase